MLKVLFPKSFCHYECSRFGAELELFARWLLAAGYLPGAATRRHVHRLKRILEATAALQCGRILLEAELDGALAFVPGALRHASTERTYRRFLKAEGRLEETRPQGPVEQLLLRYREYLLDVRGLAPATIGQHLGTIEEFLSLSAGPSQDLSALTSEYVENFIQTLSRRVLRQTLQHKVAHLRAFLRFCGDRGATARGLERIDTPRTYRGELPPACPWLGGDRKIAVFGRQD